MSDKIAKTDQDEIPLEERVFTPPARGVGSKMDPVKYNKIVHDLREGTPYYLVAENNQVSPSSVMVLRQRHGEVIPDQRQIREGKMEAVSNKMLDSLQQEDADEISAKDKSIIVGVIEDKLMASKPRLVQHQHAHVHVDKAAIRSMVEALPDDEESPDIDLSKLEDQ